MVYKERKPSEFIRIVENKEDTWNNILQQEGKDEFSKLKSNGVNYFGFDKNSGYIGYENKKDILVDYKRVYLFTKKDRSTFPYWFSHWCAFQITALTMGIWKFKYLFHDFEKPWLKLFWDYKKVQKFHRTHNNHHLEYGKLKGWNKMDWESLIIDWECSALTKQESQLDARDTLELEVSGKWKDYEKEIRNYVEPLLNKFEL